MPSLAVGVSFWFPPVLRRAGIAAAAAAEGLLGPDLLGFFGIASACLPLPAVLRAFFAAFLAIAWLSRPQRGAGCVGDRVVASREIVNDASLYIIHPLNINVKGQKTAQRGRLL